MAPIQNTTISVKITYTFEEAIEYMKMKDKYTTLQPPIRWVDSETYKEVVIGYSK